MTFLLFILAVVALAGGVYTTLHFEDGEFKGIKLTKLSYVGLGASIALFVASSVLNSPFVSVDAGSVGVVKSFGKPVGTLAPGLHVIRPYGETVTEVATQRRVVKVSEAASSSDLQIVNIEVTLGYHIDPQYAEYALVQLNNDVEVRVITPANLEAIKAQTALFDVQNLVKQRELVRSGIFNDVRVRLAAQHVVLEDMSITNFTFSPAYEAAIESKQVAEQNAEKAKNTKAQVEIEAQTVAAKAKGEADAAIAEATGKAQSIVLVAQANAKAQELQRQSLTPDLLELKRIEMWNSKWDGQLPQMITGGSGLMMQIPAPHQKGNLSKPSVDGASGQ